MRTLQVIETVQELADLFKNGKLAGCEVLVSYDEFDDSPTLELLGTEEYCIAKNLAKSSEDLIEKLLKALWIPNRC